MSENEDKQELIAMNERGMQFANHKEAFRFAQQVCESGMVPAGMNTPSKVLVAAQVGMEVGLGFMAAVNSLYIIKGKPAWYGKNAKGKILSSGVCEDWDQDWEGEGDARIAWVVSNRNGMKSKRTEFSIKQAKNMGLFKEEDGKTFGRTKTGWSKDTPWGSDPDNMLMWRAVGRHCDQWYSDILMGLPLVEVARDVDYPGSDVDPVKEEAALSKPDPLMAGLDGPPAEEPGKPQAKEHPKQTDDPPAPTEEIEEGEFEKVEEPAPEAPAEEPEAEPVPESTVAKRDNEKMLAFTLFLGSKYCTDTDNQMQVDMEWNHLLEEFKPKKKESAYTLKDYQALSDHISETGKY